MTRYHRPVSASASYAKRHRQKEAAQAAGLTLGAYRRLSLAEREQLRRRTEAERAQDARLNR